MSELIHREAGTSGIERLEAHFKGAGYSPHRHDTYAIGITLWGVQTFRYRGAQRYCHPGQCHVLHPDELHDGRPATEKGFGYRIIYVAPHLVQQALNRQPLPFVADPVIDPTSAQRRFLSRTCDLNQELDDVGRTEVATFIADMLEAMSERRARTKQTIALDALIRVRDAIAAAPAIRNSIQELENIAGIDRWSLARQFRAAFGTSPTRYRTMRQLDEVRRMVNNGASLVDASIQAGFSDQSHMSRMFKRAYGLTPARWTAATNQALS